jgi:hypothetical protein
MPVLMPSSQRDRSNVEIAGDLEETIGRQSARHGDPGPGTPGSVFARAPPGRRRGLTVEIRGYDLATLDTLAGNAALSIAECPGITDL